MELDCNRPLPRLKTRQVKDVLRMECYDMIG